MDQSFVISANSLTEYPLCIASINTKVVLLRGGQFWRLIGHQSIAFERQDESQLARDNGIQ